MKQQGFTLLELLTALIVLGIIVGLAVPSFSRMITNNRIETTANELANSILYARSEAVKRNQNIQLCAAKNALMAECDALSQWTHGWLIQISTNNEVLKLWQNTPDIVIDGPSAGISILANGMLSGTGFPIALEITAPNCGANQRRTIEINRIGNAVITRGDC